MQQPGGQTWNGGHRFHMEGGGHHWPPAGDDPTSLLGVKCAAQTITAVPAGMARKRSYHVQPRCWNEHRWFNFSGELHTALLNWLCNAKKEVVVSLPNFLCILISRSLSNLKVKYTTAFRHKRIRNCITHSKVSRNIMAANTGNIPQLRGIITSHTVCTFKMMYCILHVVAATSILRFIWWLLLC